MKLQELAKILGNNLKYKINEYRSPSFKEKKKEQNLKKALDFAAKNSPFYKNFLGKELLDFPIMNKEKIRDNFHDLVTDPKVQFDKAFLYADKKELYLNQYRVMTTSGTTGERGLILMNQREWYKAMAAYLRCYEMAGKKFSPFKPQKMAMIASHQEWHQSTKIANFSKSKWFPTLYLDVMQPIEEIVKALNEFQPDILCGYSGFIRILALEQIKGNLMLLPKSVICSAEALTEESREVIRKAWAVEAYNLYAASETGPIGMQCHLNDAIHVLDDRLMIEIVDENYNPVAEGEKGAKVLFTSLEAKSLPLIRYEVSDCLKIRKGACRCGHDGMLLENIEGRSQDQINLQVDSNRKTLHPIFFYSLMEQEWIHKWQVRQTSPHQLEILLEKADQETAKRLENAIAKKLAEHGLKKVGFKILNLDFIPLSKNGKRKLIEPLQTIDFA